MLGSIIGDIVGSIYEFDNIKTKTFTLFSAGSRFTDDTVCTVAVADSVLHQKDPTLTMVEWCRTYPGQGYGNLFMRWFNMPYQEPYNSFGNGAAMRVGAVAWLATTLEQALNISDKVTAITHNHPEGIKGARAVVHATYMARTGASPDSIRDEIAKVYGYDLSMSVDEIRDDYEFNETCQESVPQALICALESSSFEDAIRNAISIGGDSDTIGAIAGGLAEAMYGLDETLAANAREHLPKDILEIVDHFYAVAHPSPAKENVSDSLPTSVRYIKNGAGGQWWSAARNNGQVHAGWNNVPDQLLERKDLAAIEPLLRQQGGNTQDFNALRTLLDKPSRHIWITFEDGCLWWCTVKDQVTVRPGGESAQSGHFWLACDRPWQNTSLGSRKLAMADLPGIVTRTAGFKGTVCEPAGSKETLRIIQDLEDVEVAVANAARVAFEQAVASLVRRLAPKDFELLIDLILSRDGWVRVGKLGGVVEGVDLEVENASADEMAFVQVKTSAGQAELNDYIRRFNERRERYARMIFAVHTPAGPLDVRNAERVQIWDCERISQLVVKHGLANWISSRI